MSSEIVIEKRPRGRPKKEKPEKPKRQLLTEEQKKENYNRSNCDYVKRRSQFGNHLVTMLKNGGIIPASDESEKEILEWAAKFSMKVPYTKKISI
jgi:hypothetical protein